MQAATNNPIPKPNLQTIDQQIEAQWVTPKAYTRMLWEDTPQEKKDISKIFIRDFHSYQSLSKYEGLIGPTFVRAPTTFIGVEVELEKVKYKYLPQGTWKITDDGSLKDQGREFVTIPIPFRFLEIELHRLFNGLTDKHASIRCSTHIHINVRDFSLEELKTFLALYLIFEQSLYHFSGERSNNNFCVPLSFNSKMLQEFISYLNRGHVVEGWYKYTGLNLSPIWGGESKKFGTIEFRHMKGTTDVAYILNWINLIVSLKITAKKLKWEELEKHIRTMNTTSAYYWLADETFKDYAKLLVNQPTFKDNVEYGVTMAKKVFLPQEQREIIIPLKENLSCAE